jgi:hypothetical protein
MFWSLSGQGQIQWNQTATIRVKITSSEQEVEYSALNQARQGSSCCENQSIGINDRNDVYCVRNF